MPLAGVPRPQRTAAGAVERRRGLPRSPRGPSSLSHPPCRSSLACFGSLAASQERREEASASCRSDVPPLCRASRRPVSLVRGGDGAQSILASSARRGGERHEVVCTRAAAVREGNGGGEESCWPPSASMGCRRGRSSNAAYALDCQGRPSLPHRQLCRPSLAFLASLAASQERREEAFFLLVRCSSPCRASHLARLARLRGRH